MGERERPSRHGAILGQALAEMAEAGGGCAGTCATCAFRPGTMTNQMAATGLTALHCALGTDPDPFGCHHGMKDGRPTKLCAGYEAARQVSFDEVAAIMERLKTRMDAMTGPDDVRAIYDAWAAEADPDDALDDYQLARLYEKHRPTTQEGPNP